MGRFPFLRAGRHSFAHFWLLTTAFCSVVLVASAMQAVSLVWMPFLCQERGQEEVGASRDHQGMCCASRFTRFWEVLTPFCRFSSSKGGGGHSHCSCSTVWGGWDVLLLKARAYFSALLISGGPARLSDGGGKCANTLDHCSSACPRLEPCSFLTGPAFPASIWDQSATRDHGLGSSDYPSPLYFPGQAHTSLGRWVGVKRDGCCLKRKGPVRAISLPGTPLLPAVGLCSAVGILS